MTNHFIHYIKREIKGKALTQVDFGEKEAPFYVVNQNVEDGFGTPQFHVTRCQSGPCTEIGVNSIIWIFSVLSSPWGSLPPSLDAKIIVRGKEVKDGKIIFHASEDSKWFPLFDATAMLQKLYTIDKNEIEKPLWPMPHKAIGIYLQSIRKLKSNHGLNEWSDGILESEFDFISYRIKDGTKQAFQKTKSLLSTNRVVYWDRFSLPRRLVERREQVDSQVLDETLVRMIHKCSNIWGIESPKYFENESYSQKESALGKELNKYHSVEVI